MSSSRAIRPAADDAPVFRRIRNPAAQLPATYSEPLTLEGCSSRVCADAGDDIGGEAGEDRLHAVTHARRDKRRAMKLAQPLQGDGIPPDMCARCGLRGGPHLNAAVCIERLRDLVAELSIR